MTGRCEGGHVVALRELNLVILDKSRGRQSLVAFVCNDCVAASFGERTA